MPIAGQGMLLTSMDIAPEDEADFNRWYDREHIAERVAIDGFVEARRYVALEAAPKYLGLYSTERFEVLSSDAYHTALANQTEWSKRNIAKFKNMIRGVARITLSRGQGRGAVLGLVRIRPAAGQEGALRTGLSAKLDPLPLDGIISMHLLENDPALSRPLTDPPGITSPGASDWFVLIDGTSAAAVGVAMAGRFEAAIADARAELIAAGTYALLWDLAKADLGR
ncbi:hypothetical protein BJ123_11649 [Rhodopseudomonas thermotolerans]|uniref:Uncharacterized protein n=2 Tax=Rhodopseudomonas TaxID=1073 RepID=A0A336JWS0_9BRAD|nr:MULTISPECIES: DUF4286 family protein [Rhodopseudomonas]RED30541.1 hypothetical protein BJ125_11649 [Rhodopseudomonas pentothenatexigens]REF92645.1 hypothetical protein BJ123_11649 [Rhodopseudomonas thermotolerans]SSW92074.1 hypothetical protein SAMN05892882_11649 [Rhodopseudomonas pentothenatexigens]